MTRLIFMLLAILLLAPATIPLAAQQQDNAANRSLRTLAEQQGIDIGTLGDIEPLYVEEAYTDTLAREFNVLIPHNVLKMRKLLPRPGEYDFEAADELIAFAQANDMKVRGHALIYAQANPRWMGLQEWTRDELIDFMRDHIYTVVGRYKGQIYAWDVVNEAFNPDGTLKNTLYREVIGPEYIALAFQFAREADPDALLFYNEIDAEGINPKSNAIYASVQRLIEVGVPIDGIGFEMHIQAQAFPDPANVRANMARLAELGLIVHITEMDVRIYRTWGTSKERLAAQAVAYGTMLSICLEASNCDLFAMWGFTDKYSWIYDAYQGEYPGEAPLIFDPEYKPKQAYFMLQDVLTLWPELPPALAPQTLPPAWPVGPTDHDIFMM